MQAYIDTVWHKWLKRPYRLASPVDTGRGTKHDTTIVLLHGLGQNSGVWQKLITVLSDRPYRLISFDLLGFGDSPKPDWKRYDVDDHVEALAHAIRRKRPPKPVIIVGHSMGCLIAVRLASRYPQLVRHLVLYEMPLYSGLPETRLYRLRLTLYFKLYERITEFRPIFSGAGKSRAQKLVEKISGFTFDDTTWRPFVKSLKHTIMEQTTNEDLKHVSVPIDVIYGSRDQLVFRGETKLIFGEDAKNVTAHTIRESHRISAKASAFLADRINSAASKGHTKREMKAGHRLTRRKQRRAQPSEETPAANG